MQQTLIVKVNKQYVFTFDLLCHIVSVFRTILNSTVKTATSLQHCTY